MKGCVKNVSKGWAHAFKRAVAPGEEIPLDDLYAVYGEKHNIAEGDDFIRWIKDVKLSDPNRWRVCIDEVPEPVVEVKAEPADKNPKEMDVMDVVEMSVRRAKEILPKMTDLKLLKYAYKEANGRSGKDSLCRLLKKRVNELGTHSRY